MSKRFFASCVFGLSIAAGMQHNVARAEDMDLALSRLSVGECEATLSDTAPKDFDLKQGGAQTLVTDEEAWRSLVTQLSPVVTPAVLAPVTTSGPRGVDVSVQTSVTGIKQSADYWERGTEGHGPDSVETCDGRNRFVSPVLVHNRLVFNKGLPLGLTIGAEIGRVWNTSLWTIGGTLKLALFEGYRKLAVPDLAVRASGSTVVGDPQFSMTTITGEAILSKNIVVGRVAQFSPFLGAGGAWTFAASELIDLTPNIDAFACAQGKDAICNKQMLDGAARSDDVGHDVPFEQLRLTRYRGFAGLMFRYGAFSLAAELMMDLLAPDAADKEAGPSTPKQWTLSLAPALTY